MEGFVIVVIHDKRLIRNTLDCLFRQTMQTIEVAISNLKLTKVKSVMNPIFKLLTVRSLFSDLRNPEITYWHYENLGVGRLANRER